MDLLRTITLSPGGRPIVRVNLADPTGLTVYTERSTFNISPAAHTPNWSRSSRKGAGSVQSGQSDDNSTALASWWIKGGGNPNTVLANAELLMAEIDDSPGLNPNQPKYLEWRPDGASFSTLLELRGSGVYVPHYEWAAFTGAQMLKLDLSWPVAPLARGLPLDIADPFDVDSRADYTVDVGPAFTYTPPTPSGAGGSVSVAGTPAESVFRHTARGYRYDDVQVTAQIQVGSGTPTTISVICAWVDANNYLLCQLSVGGHTQLYKKQAGVFTLLNGAIGPSFSANTTYWLRIRLEGNLLVGETATVIPPGPLSPINDNARYVLNTAEQALFGAGGGVGVRSQSAPADMLLQYFEALPYTYRNARLPETFILPQVPGSASPIFDVQVTTAAPPVPVQGAALASGSLGTFPSTGVYRYKVTALGEWGESAPSNEISVTVAAVTQDVQLSMTSTASSAGVTGWNVYRTVAGGAVNTEVLLSYLTNVPPSSFGGGTPGIQDIGGPAGTSITPPVASTFLAPQWGLVSWTQRARAWNRVWNGDFENNIDGWALTATQFHQPAVSLVRSTTQPDSGIGHAILAVDASVVNEGTHFRIFRCFKAGVTYTFIARLSAPVLADNVTVTLGVLIPTSVGSSSIDAASFTQALASNYQTWTGTWTPQADYNFADLSITHVPNTAGNIYIDGAAAYETAQGAPTLTTQTYGRGAHPPFGYLDPAARIPADTTGGVISQVAGSITLSPSGWFFNATVPGSGPGSSLIDWWIDPSLYATPDDFARGQIAVEAFYLGRADVVNPRIILSAVPDPSQSLGQERFTQEYGNTGRLLVSSGAPNARYSRLGTLILPVNPSTPVRWKLKAAFAWTSPGGGSFNMSGLLLAHSLRRACSPTGKSRVDGTYPAWTSSTAQVIKTIRSSLRAVIALAPTGSSPGQYALLPSLQGDDSGLSGAPLELSPPVPTAAGLQGDHQLFVALAPLVPDDPSGEAFAGGLQTAATVHVAVTPRYRLARFS